MPKAPHAPWAAAFGWLLSHGCSWDTHLWLGILSLSISQALLSCHVTGDSMSLCACRHHDNVLHYFSFFVLHWSNSTVAAELCAMPGPVWKTDDCCFFFSSKDAIIFLCEIILCWSPRWHILFIVSVLGENFFTPQCFLRMENHNWISPCTHGRAGSVLQQGKCTLQDANSAIILVSCI